MNQPIYPKKNPGATNVRTSPKVNNGVVNNLLLSVPYGQLIGLLNNEVLIEVVQSKTYLWFVVETPKGRGYVREDTFSFSKSNAESQGSPEKERARIAQAQLERTVKTLQLVGDRLTKVKKFESKLTKPQTAAMLSVQNSYVKAINRLQTITGNRLKLKASGVSGFGFLPAIPVILAVGSLLVIFASFVVERALKWYADIKQTQAEAEQQLAVIKTLENVTNSPTADQATQQKAVEKLAVISKQTADSTTDRNESNKSGDLIGNIKNIATAALLGFFGLEVYKAYSGSHRR